MRSFNQADVFDVDYFIQQTKGFVEIVRELPEEIASREPFKVDCSKCKGLFDYVEAVLPSLLEAGASLYLYYASNVPKMRQVILLRYGCECWCEYWEWMLVSTLVAVPGVGGTLCWIL